MRANLVLVTCPLCLNVRRGAEWIDAERMIRETRSYELAALPQLISEVCARCDDAIARRRAQKHAALAA